MLAIRMQRSGRKGHAMFRVVVQDSRRTPTSGKLVAQLGSYDPHAKTVIVDKDKAQFYLDNGAQPSERVARLLKSEGIKLPKWVATPITKQRGVRNADKRRSTRPEAPVEEVAESTEPVESVEVDTEPNKAVEDQVPADTKEEPAEDTKEDSKPEAETTSEEETEKAEKSE